MMEAVESWGSGNACVPTRPRPSPRFGTPRGVSLEEKRDEPAKIAPVRFRLNPDFEFNMARKRRWKLVRDSSAEQGTFVPEVVEFLRQGEPPVTGRVMMERVKAKKPCGQRHAEAIMRGLHCAHS